MKEGTRSVLFGGHSVGHSIVVLVAWRRHYHRWPAWWEVACIFLHDIGHWGKDYLSDYEQKKQHAELGSRVAGWLFGEKGRALVAGHNAYVGEPRSALYFPDKYSWVIAPTWWITFNAWVEPPLRRPGCTCWESAVLFQGAMRDNMAGGFQEQGHDVYLRQIKQYTK